MSRTILAGILLAGLAAACAAPADRSPGANALPDPAPHGAGIALAGTHWDVVAYNDGQRGVVGLLPGTRISARFDAQGQVTGSAGCNRYFASYRRQGANISFGTGATTRKYCAEPPGLMRQESLYLNALRSSATVALDGDRLELRTADRGVAVVLERGTGD